MARTAIPDGRDRILDVAARLFYEQGIRAVGMKQIIDEAGSGKSLLYGHFATKDDLVEAYLERAATRLGRSSARVLQAAGDDPGERIVALVTEAGRRILRPGGRGCPFRNYLVEFPDGDEVVAEGTGSGPAARARRTLKESHSVLDRSAKELAGPVAGAVLAEQIGLIMDGLFARASYRARGDDEPPVSAVLAAVELARTLVAQHRASGDESGR
ncbi:TetR/AcrR family transcriptional regulator [Pseudonocardia parietis]|uniref:AcrR family transcriptional regulator n=1 Tax=Pseudonocardia parietis TaxID=570936 RepID=A0ABS4VL15_9PSEU|nr:helix-turn-helix domain-containing protein [Pseudonocardia parietis]MBP2364612.1 AcrR family transcriptional regulator [Pseudonocardia parietis]